MAAAVAAAAHTAPGPQPPPTAATPAGTLASTPLDAGATRLAGVLPAKGVLEASPRRTTPTSVSSPEAEPGDKRHHRRGESLPQLGSSDDTEMADASSSGPPPRGQRHLRFGDDHPAEPLLLSTPRRGVSSSQAAKGGTLPRGSSADHGSPALPMRSPTTPTGPGRLRIGTHNATGLGNGRAEAAGRLWKQLGLDVVLVQETHLTSATQRRADDAFWALGYQALQRRQRWRGCDSPPPPA